MKAVKWSDDDAEDSYILFLSYFLAKLKKPIFPRLAEFRILFFHQVSALMS